VAKCWREDVLSNQRTGDSRVVIQTRVRGGEIVHQRQLAVRITDTHYSSHAAVADHHPVHVTARTADADVVERREALASEKFDITQINDELLRDADVALDLQSECVAVSRIDLAGYLC